MKKALVIVLIIILIAGIALEYAHRHSSRPAAPGAPAAAAMKTYTNTTYGYSLSYPASLSVEEYPNGDAVIGDITDQNVNGVAETHVLSLSNTPSNVSDNDFVQAAAKQLANYCAADGPTGSFSCAGVASSTAFTTTNGTNGYELYLNGEMNNFQTKQKSSVLKGPYFVFPLNTSATSTEILSIQAPLAQTAAEADASTIEAIAKSLTLNQ